MLSFSSRPALTLGTVLPALLLLGACSQTAPVGQPVTLSGHIDNPTGPKVRLTLFRDPMHLEADTVSARLDAKGNFRLVLPQVAAPGEASFTDGNESTDLFLEPGDELQLSLDTKQFDETLKYKGRGADANNYLIQSFLRFDDGDNATPMRFVLNKTAEQMSQGVEADERQRREFWQQYAGQHQLTPAFRAYVRQELKYSAANQRLMCAGFYRYMQQEEKKTPVPLPASFLGGLTALAAPNDSALNNAAYVAFAEQYPFYQLQNDASGKAPTNPDELMSGVFDLAARTYGNTRTRDVVLSKVMLSSLVNAKLSTATAQMPTFRRLNRDSVAARAVRNAYAKRLALAPGNAAPAFTLQDETGKQVALSSFRGKVVYLDFWASWCGPCLAEVPAAKELKQKFAGRDVVFLYVSLDEKEEDWQKILAKQQLLGHGSVHLRAQGFESAAAKAYQVQAIPSYFIIGRDGRVVADRAARPSSGAEIVKDLEAALAAPAAGAVAAR
ncbi:TlpA family protein disulfide reductase [Hymenobacter gummosus]|uniref:TlpA family protein disulfide reductase n=1 Tax=Hymenobacter gummosus TaxID=1776032 RepID=A0A3S0QLG6_9BACT|nr:TlpA disulfide reductase family protein [Hymenobacter gummosus]RTQ53708.1 TlpA family protein disulfide reductase [Hymenobacter gummosus]